VVAIPPVTPMHLYGANVTTFIFRRTNVNGKYVPLVVTLLTKELKSFAFLLVSVENLCL
jgi:hypothetical protein